jgi:hypothetical protein
LTNQRIFIGGDAISNGLNLTGNLSNIRITKGVAVYTTNFTIPTTNFTVTQTANVNGNPSAEITAGQTQLLLNTNFGTGLLTDTSTNNFTVVNNGGVTSSNYEPFTPVHGPTPTPTTTSTPTETPTNTQTSSVTPTLTPTPSTSPTPVTGYGYNLVVLPYNPPTSGNTIFPTFATPGDMSGTTNPNTFNVNGVYWNQIDNLSVNRASYYSGMTGVSVTAYFTQNGNTAIYSGSSTAFIYEGTPGSEGFNYNPNARPGQLTLIQSASTNFITGQTVYISYVVNVAVTPTPTSTSTPTTTQTPTVTPTNTTTTTQTPTNTTTTTPTPSSTPAVPVTDNLVLYFDPSNPSSYPGTGTTINDLSGNGLNGSMSGITFTTPYFSYNGTSSQIRVADNALLEPGSGDWSMEVWVNQAVLGNDVVLGKFDNGGLTIDVSYAIRTTNTTYYAQIGSGSGSGSSLFVNSTNYVGTIDTWYQIVYVFTNVASNTLETFVNGVSIGSVGHSLASILNSTNPLYIGSYNGGEFTQWFDGKIGISRLYNASLTSAQVLQNFNADKSKYGL